MKGFARFLEITATDVTVDASRCPESFGSRFEARRVALVSRIANGDAVSLSKDFVSAFSRDDDASLAIDPTNEAGSVRESFREEERTTRDHSAYLDGASTSGAAGADEEGPRRRTRRTRTGERERASFEDGRLDVTLRYALRDGRVAVAEAALTVARAEAEAPATEDEGARRVADERRTHDDDDDGGDDDDDDDDDDATTTTTSPRTNADDRVRPEADRRRRRRL